MSELPAGIAPAEPARPKDSASGVILRKHAAGGWSVLLGLRSRRSRFLPGHLACPGGRLDDEDRPGEPGAFARCAAREVFEETGVAIPAKRWFAAGERTTPPIFPLRFRTRFFVAELPADLDVPEVSPSPAEIEELRLSTPREVIDEWRNGRVLVPPPTLAILRALVDAGAAPLEELAGVVAAANAREESTPRIEFSSGIWMLPVRTATLPPASHTNVWMPGGWKFVIIDPGSADEAENRHLLDAVERRRSEGDEPVAVLLTHHHRDHVSGALPVARALHLPLRAHPQVLGTLPTDDGGVERFALSDGDEIDLDGVVLRALHTPGHAPGHLAFHLAGTPLVIVGDLASGLSTILIDPSEGDMGAYLESLHRVAGLGCRRLFPSHGPPLPGKALERLIEHRREREGKILDRLEGGEARLAVIAAGAYEDLPRVPTALTERQALSHLLHLERQGKARRAGSNSDPFFHTPGPVLIEWLLRSGRRRPPRSSRCPPGRD